MADELIKNEVSGLTLGEYLSSIRNDRKMTLREVEEKTKKEISNAYLSQIENGKIKKPSPNILYSLSELYEINFEKLMTIAGHVVAQTQSSDETRHGRAATFAEHNLTSEEEKELLSYLKYIRSKNLSG